MTSPETTPAPRRGGRSARTAVLFVLAAAVLSVGAAAAAVVSAGTVAVRFSAPAEGGSGVRIALPAALIDLALAAAPDEAFAEVSAELGRGPVRIAPEGLRKLASAIRDLPDAVLVEVADGSSRILVEKRGRTLRVRIEEPDTDVRVDVPVRIAVRLLERVAAT